MKIQELQKLTRDKVYSLATTEKITNDTPIESSDKRFPEGGRAYLWTNEQLFQLRNHHNLDLNGRSMLVVAASGDPLATFACLNAGTQIGFDTSHRAILWDELKLAMIDRLNFWGFRQCTGMKVDVEKEKKYWGWIEPRLSDYARSIFAGKIKQHGSIRKFMEDSKYFRYGCSDFWSSCNIYSTSEQEYQKARLNLRANKPILIPGGLDVVLKLTEEKFGGFYGSNILDHFRNTDGYRDGSEPNIRPFLEFVDSRLTDDAVMILQFEHNSDLRDNVAPKILKSLGYSFSLAQNNQSGGYGNIAVARRKKK